MPHSRHKNSKVKPDITHHHGPEITRGTKCQLCGMVAEVALTDQHGITHHYCLHHVPQGMPASEELHPGDDHAHGHAHHVNIFRQKFWVSLLLTVPVVLYSSMIQEWIGFSMPKFAGSSLIPLVFGSLVFVYGGTVFIRSAVSELRSRQPGMMTLISLAIVVAYGYSVANFFLIGGMDFFWDLSTLIVIMLLGHWLEMKSVANTQGALSELAKLLPDTAELAEDQSSRQIAVALLTPGNIVRVRPGSTLPADGVVIEGQSSVNESMVTGESYPVKKIPGDKIIAGTINQDGGLLVEVTNTGDSTVLSKIMRLVAEAQESKSNTQLLADKAAGWLFYVALISGAITFIGWLTIGGAEVGFAFERLVTVLIIACPHALGLAIPLATSISTSLAARNGLLVRDRKALESARNTEVVIFDKTGTLTTGEQNVADVWPAATVSKKSLLAKTAAAEYYSEHIIGKAIVHKATDENIKLPKSSRFSAIPGKGVRAIISGRNILVGGPQLLEAENISLPEVLNKRVYTAGNQGKTVVFAIEDNNLLGAITLADTIRPESYGAVEQLQQLGVRVAMLTGDSQEVASYVADQLGVEEYVAQVLPEHKAEAVRRFQSGGAIVAMAGDGINDAPALAQADIGVAIGSGTDVAIESAGIILTKNDPLGVVKIIGLSRGTYAKMVQNLWWGAGYNVAAIPLAAGALAPFGYVLPPVVGAVIMSLSTIIVALNAQTLRRLPLGSD